MLICVMLYLIGQTLQLPVVYWCFWWLAVVFYTIRLFVNIYKAGQDARTKNK